MWMGNWFWIFKKIDGIPDRFLIRSHGAQRSIRSHVAQRSKPVRSERIYLISVAWQSMASQFFGSVASMFVAVITPQQW